MNKLEKLKETVNKGNFPNKHKKFGGANLIITSNKNREFREGDTVIYSAHASALSWLVFELKKIYDSDINYLNKYDFYPSIGKLIKESLQNDALIFESMIYVIEKIEKAWGIK
jgi:hypothetical protein